MTQLKANPQISWIPRAPPWPFPVETPSVHLKSPRCPRSPVQFHPESNGNVAPRLSLQLIFGSFNIIKDHLKLKLV